MPYEPVGKLDNIEEHPPEPELAVMLDSNEAFYDLNGECPAISEKIADEVRKLDFSRYPDPNYKRLTNALAQYYGVDPEYVTAGNGADELICLAEGTLFQKGDIIVTLSPDFSMYAFYGAVCELKVQTIAKEDDFTVDIAKIIKFCNTNNVKGVIFSNPCSPTSLGITADEMARLLKNLFCLVIVDETYMDFWDQSAAGLVGEYDNLVVIKSCSSSPGIAALRIGCIIAGKEITESLKKAKASNISVLTEAAVCAVLDEKELIKSKTEKVIESKDYLMKNLQKIAAVSMAIDKVYESVTNFVTIKSAYAQKLHDKLEEASVTVMISKNFLRITAGTKEQDDIIISVLQKAADEIDKGEEL